MVQHILKIAIEYRGRHKKVSQFLMLLKSANSLNLCLNNKNVFILNCGKMRTMKEYPK